MHSTSPSVSKLSFGSWRSSVTDITPPPDQRYTRKLPPEFSSLMVKFSSKNPQDRLALISAGINNRVTADQRSVSDTFIFSCVSSQSSGTFS
ncbi:hypothetical protein P692DRAFT_20834332 [Suillus brevipes Sb2]|nr:hypothetical protein P692DRAFT_20834332 [Suillus brevipes Sb2]